MSLLCNVHDIVARLRSHKCGSNCEFLDLASSSGLPDFEENEKNLTASVTKARTVCGTLGWRVYVNLFPLLSCQPASCSDGRRPGGAQQRRLAITDVTFMLYNPAAPRHHSHSVHINVPSWWNMDLFLERWEKCPYLSFTSAWAYVISTAKCQQVPTCSFVMIYS